MSRWKKSDRFLLRQIFQRIVWDKNGKWRPTENWWSGVKSFVKPHRDQNWNSRLEQTNVCVVRGKIDTFSDRRSSSHCTVQQEEENTMHSLSNSLFGNQDSYWRGAMTSPYSSLQPLSSMTSNLPSSYSPYDQYSSHHAVTGR